MGRWLIKGLIVVVLLAVLAGGGSTLWVYTQFTRPGPHEIDATLIIKPGSGLKSIARQLQAGGVVKNAIAFELGARLSGEVNDLHAGEFVFKAGISARETLAVLKVGKTVLRRFTIVEGFTTAQIIEQISTIEGLSGEVYFANPSEGALLPETYFFSYGEDRQDVVERMRLGMTDVLNDLWDVRAENLPFKTPQEALILASIVEKETGVPVKIVSVGPDRKQTILR